MDRQRSNIAYMSHTQSKHTPISMSINTAQRHVSWIRAKMLATFRERPSNVALFGFDRRLGGAVTTSPNSTLSARKHSFVYQRLLTKKWNGIKLLWTDSLYINQWSLCFQPSKCSKPVEFFFCCFCSFSFSFFFSFFCCKRLNETKDFATLRMPGKL